MTLKIGQVKYLHVRILTSQQIKIGTPEHDSLGFWGRKVKCKVHKLKVSQLACSNFTGRSREDEF